MRQRPGLSLIGGAVALALAATSAVAMPAGGGPSQDGLAPASNVVSVGWRRHGGFGISVGVYPGYYGYRSYYPDRYRYYRSRRYDGYRDYGRYDDDYCPPGYRYGRYDRYDD